MIKIFYREIKNPKSYSHKFLKEIYELQFGLPFNDSLVSFNLYGKPYLNGHSNIYFNLSHSKGAIICAFSTTPIGIDIELVKSCNYQIANRFFTKDEQNYIFCKEDNKDLRFFEIWTKKEAYVKWLGLGIAMEFDSFSIINRNELISFHINNYCISVCTSEIEKGFLFYGNFHRALQYVFFL